MKLLEQAANRAKEEMRRRNMFPLSGYCGGVANHKLTRHGCVGPHHRIGVRQQRWADGHSAVRREEKETKNKEKRKMERSRPRPRLLSQRHRPFRSYQKRTQARAP